MRRRRGMSLAEVLVAMALLGMLMALIVMLLRPGWRAWTRGARKSEAQQACLVTLTRLAQDYRNAHAGSLRVISDPPDDPEGRKAHRDRLLFLSNLDSWGTLSLDRDGDATWQRWIHVYLDREGQVRVQETALDPPTSMPPLQNLPLPIPSENDRIIARHIRSLRIDERAAPMLGITVEAEVDGFSSRQASSVVPLMQAFAPPSSSAASTSSSP